MMTTNQPPQTDDTDRQLAILDQASNALAAPDAAVEAIGAHLDALYANGAPGDVLDSIQASAVEMAETVNQHFAALRTGLDLAKRIREQRDSTLKTLEELRTAIRTVDYTVPEVEALRETIEEVILEWHSMTWGEDAWDYVIEILESNGPLDSDELGRLFDLLNGDGPDWDNDLWPELREWIERAESDAADARQVRFAK